MRSFANCAAALVLFTVSIILYQPSAASAQNTAFMYQGQLNNNGSTANGSYDMAFTLYDSTNDPGNILAGPVTNTAVMVSNGLFSTLVDFGNAYSGASNWLEIAISTNGANVFSTLAPRQQLTPVPDALFANTASNVSGTFIGDGSGLTDLDATNLTGIVPFNDLPCDLVTNDETGVTLNGAFIGDGSGLTDLDATNLTGIVPFNDLPCDLVTNDETGVTLNGAFSGDGSGLTNVPGALIQTMVSETSVAAQPNTAYDLTNDSLVTVTLPSSANVGNVVQINGTGSGGWQVIGGVNSDGSYAWTESTTSGTTRQSWQSVASSANGNNLVAVVYDGGIWTSTNSGMTWTESTSSGTIGQSWYCVASSASGSNLVAVAIAGANAGGIWASTNSGVTWTKSTTSGTTGQLWTSVASSASGSDFVAVATAGGIWMSTNSGATWTESTSSGTLGPSWHSVASSSSGSNLVVVANAGGIWTSTNSGVTWTESTTSGTTSQYWRSVASSSSGSSLVAVVDPGGIWTSTNSGVTWTESTTSGTTSQYWESVASSSSGSNLVAVAYEGGIWTSTNSGVTWTESATSGTTNESWFSVASSSSGNNLVALVDGGGIWFTTGSAIGLAGSSQEFEYLGDGIWQPLIPSLGYNGGELTNLNASNLAGTVSFINLPGDLVTNNETGVTLSGTFSGNGSGLTLLAATNVSGTFPQGNLGMANSYTPVIGDGINFFTTSTAEGYYLKEGNMVYVEIHLIWTSKGSASSILELSLPVPVAASQDRALFTLGYLSDITFSHQLVASAPGGQSNVQLYDLSPGGSPSNIQVSACGSTGEIQITGTYRWQ